MYDRRIVKLVVVGVIAAALTGVAKAPPCPCDCADPPDGVVNVVDFLALLAQWGGPGSCNCADGGNGVVGVVDIDDFLMMLSTWGPCP